MPNSFNYNNSSNIPLYEEKYTIDHIKKNKIAIRIDSQEKVDKLHPLFSEMGGSWSYKTALASYPSGVHINGEDGCYCNEEFYTKRGYKIIDYSQINFEENMEKKLIGYRCPTDLYGGSVKLGTVFFKRTREDVSYVPQAAQDSRRTYYIPKEVVETWEPVYEEEFKVGDWVTYIGGNGGMDTIKWIPGKVTGKINKISGNTLDVAFGSNHIGGFRKATSEEIEAVSSIVINGHKAEKKAGGEIAFGCQVFSRDDLISIQKLFHKEVNAKLTIHGVEITNEIITKLLQL